MRACSSDLSLKLRVGGVLSYERAVINLTHTENEIHGHELSAVLANTISNQYSLQSDHHLATTMQHDTHINLIQSSKKRSRNFDRTSLYDRRHERIMNEDPNPAPRMNRYGYDGPNRHQFGGNKIPIPDRYLNPQSQQTDQPRYPHMQSAPPPAHSPPPYRFSPNRSHHNNNNSSRQNNNTSFAPNNANRQHNNNDPQINVTFSPETYTPHSGHVNSQYRQSMVNLNPF